MLTEKEAQRASIGIATGETGGKWAKSANPNGVECDIRREDLKCTLYSAAPIGARFIAFGT